MPLVAIVQLDASALEVGIITSAEFFAYAGLGLVAGVYVDRWKRRTVMLAADASRAAIIATVPLLAAAGLLRIWHLYAVALVVGTLSLFFDTASQAYLPTILSRERLVAGNSRLQASASVTQLGGPGLAGVLVQVLGAANTLLTHAGGLLVSFLAVLAIRGRAETHVASAPADGDAARETIASRIVEGFRYVRQDPILVGVLATTAHFNLLITAEEALRVVFLVRSVGASPALIGLLLSAGGAGAVLGAVFAARLASWLGVGKTLLLGASIGPVLGLLIPFTRLDTRLVFFALGTAGLGATTTILKVVGTSYRQAIVPPHLLGRVVATMRTLTWGPLPLAGLLGGGIGQLLGPRPGFLVLALLMLPAPLWLLRTPLWKVRDFHELAA
jgi:MFS family permease